MRCKFMKLIENYAHNTYKYSNSVPNLLSVIVVSYWCIGLLVTGLIVISVLVNFTLTSQYLTHIQPYVL